MTLVLRLSAAALAALLLALALVPEGAAAAQCKGGDASPAKLSDKRAARAVLCLINKQRRRHHLRPLRRHRAQTEAARAHNRRMVERGCFSHRCPGEPDLAGRLTRAGYLPCGCSWGIAENIAFGSGRAGSPRSIVDAWMSSAGHRANILGAGYRHIGVAVDSGTPAAGRRRDGATYTTDFGYKR
ncbi:MAG: CAP domain-containing protein [Acidobacteria bacterium]|nr:MAG: CAP domain-containing protein [Acidobacteriota bacterium]